MPKYFQREGAGNVDDGCGRQGRAAKTPGNRRPGLGTPDFPEEHGREENEVNQPVRGLQKHIAGNLIVLEADPQDDEGENRKKRVQDHGRYCALFETASIVIGFSGRLRRILV